MVFGVEWPGNADQDLCEIRIDPPIAKLIGIGQSRLRDLAPDTHVVELATDRTKARFNVTQALAVGQLSKHHRQELIPARKRFYMVVALIARDALLEIRVGYVINELRENGSANVHSYIVPSKKKSLCRQEKSLFWLRFLCLSFKSFLLTIAATIFHTISCSRRSNFTRTAVIHHQPQFPFNVLPPHVAVHKGLELLHAIQNSLQLHPVFQLLLRYVAIPKYRIGSRVP